LALAPSVHLSRSRSRSPSPSSPHPSRHAASFVKVTRASARLRATSERLEREASAAHFVHIREAQAAAERAAGLCNYLEQQRMTSEVAVLQEVRTMEEDHELGTWQMRKAWQVELEVVAAAREQERLRAVDEKAEVQAQLVRAQVEQREATERIIHLEDKVTGLLEENAQIRAEWKANLEALRVDSNSYLGNLRGAHSSEVKRLEAALEHMIKEKGELHEALLKQESKNTHMQGQKGAMEQELQRQLRGVRQEKIDEGERLQKEIDHLKQVHTAALAAGTIKGRQLLLMETFKAPTRRANEPEDTEPRHHSQISWRQADDVDHLTRQQVGDEIVDFDKGLDVVERMFRTSTTRVPSDARARSLASRPASQLSHAADVWTTPESRAGSGAPSS